MANLDTRSKRSSSVQLMLPFLVAPVYPDGSLKIEDRAHMVANYSGLVVQTGYLVKHSVIVSNQIVGEVFGADLAGCVFSPVPYCQIIS